MKPTQSQTHLDQGPGQDQGLHNRLRQAQQAPRHRQSPPSLCTQTRCRAGQRSTTRSSASRLGASL